MSAHLVAHSSPNVIATTGLSLVEAWTAERAPILLKWFFVPGRRIDRATIVVA
jgi:hypothetical protein